jgi:hypothetical protein
MNFSKKRNRRFNMWCLAKVIAICLAVGGLALAAYYFKSKLTKKNEPGKTEPAPVSTAVADPCASGACASPAPVVNLGATAVKAFLVPSNTLPVPPDVFCTKTTSITGWEEITDPDGETVIVREWFDNGHLRAVNTCLLPGPFGYGHEITYRVTADKVSSEQTVKITCGLNYFRQV